jgi:hypothetical protein
MLPQTFDSGGGETSSPAESSRTGALATPGLVPVAASVSRSQQPKVGRGAATPLVLLEIELNLLPFGEAYQSGALERRGVNEDVTAAVDWLDKPKPLGGIVELDRSGVHMTFRKLRNSVHGLSPHTLDHRKSGEMLAGRSL